MVWKGDGTNRLAKSLIVLFDQLDAALPANRDRSSDGTLGDAAHQATQSEHNPDKNGVVRALDITNDPAHGVSSRAIAESLVASHDPRIRYVISKGQIARSYPKPTINPWTWSPYTGANDHSGHFHISVVDDPVLYDDLQQWKIGSGSAQPGDTMFTNSGKGSWYSQFVGKHVWVDRGDKPGSAALGVPDDAQGIAFNDRSTLGKWFLVAAPNGKVSIEQQTDIGPNPSTGRLIDISAASAERFGYSPDDFPTDGMFSWGSINPPTSVASLTPQQQAVTFRDLRGRDGEVLDPLPPAGPAAPAPAAGNPLLLILMLALLSKEKPMATDPTQPAGQAPDLAKVLLPLLLQSVISGKPLDANALLPAIFGSILGVPLALPAPTPATPPPTSTPATPTGQPDILTLLLPLLLQGMTSPAKPAATDPAKPATPATTTTPDKAVTAVSAIAFIISALLQGSGAIGTPFGMFSDPTTVGSVATGVPLAGIGLGALGAITPIIDGFKRLFNIK